MILLGHKEAVANWICDRIRDMPHIPRDVEYEAIGFLDANGQIKGGVIYTNCSTLPDGTRDIHMTAAGEVGWFTKSSLRVIFGYPFQQLNCSRVTALSAKSNRRVRNVLERLGFKHEGTVRWAFGKDRDGILMGLLRPECKWID